MIEDGSTPILKSPPPSTPRLRAARLEDYEQIARLGLEHSLDVPDYEDWSSLWLNNPLRGRLGKDFPIGWVLETEYQRIGWLHGNGVVALYISR